MNDWLPIETGPKDGTRVLLSDGHTIRVGSFDDEQARWAVLGIGNYPATHWMPLPDPPSDSKT